MVSRRPTQMILVDLETQRLAGKLTICDNIKEKAEKFQSETGGGVSGLYPRMPLIPPPNT